MVQGGNKMKKIIYILLLSFCINSINAADEQTLLETVGFLSASKVMITAYGLGSAYDGWVTDSYDDQDFEEMIASFQEIIISVSQQLYSLSEYARLADEDAEFVSMVIVLYDAMLKESNSMLKYSYTRKN